MKILQNILICASMLAMSTLAASAQQSGGGAKDSITIRGTLPGFLSTPTFNMGTIAGIATAVKQPAFGTAGISSADVLTIQGRASMTPVMVDSNTSFAVNAEPSPTTTGGLSTFVLQPAASDNHQNITTVASQIYHISVYNNSATVNYLRFYNAGAGFNGCNSVTNLKHKVQIPANTAVGGVVEDIAMGLKFPLGIAICVVSGYANNSTAAATASAIDINVDFVP